MLDPTRAKSSPWHNGAGSTRELAAETDLDGQTRWRISVASLDHDAPFSVFPGMDRLLVALGPLRITVDGATSALNAGDQVRFAGESAVAVALDEPTTALNVMTRRNRYRAEVSLRDADQVAPAGVDATVRLEGLDADIHLLKTEAAG
jgi:environmental stress-induced protein Ves